MHFVPSTRKGPPRKANHQAPKVAGQQYARLLRAGIRIVHLWREQGKHAEARDPLAPVYNWFTEGFDTSVLQDAKALLDRLT